jgi:hypothetical protein
MALPPLDLFEPYRDLFCTIPFAEPITSLFSRLGESQIDNRPPLIELFLHCN